MRNPRKWSFEYTPEISKLCTRFVGDFEPMTGKMLPRELMQYAKMVGACCWDRAIVWMLAGHSVQLNIHDIYVNNMLIKCRIRRTADVRLI